MHELHRRRGPGRHHPGATWTATRAVMLPALRVVKRAWKLPDPPVRGTTWSTFEPTFREPR